MFRTRVVWGFLVLVFAGLAWDGVRGKSATMDEPMEGVAAFAAARDGEFRLGADTPVLAKYFAMIGENDDALDLRYEGPRWERGTWPFTRGAYLAAGSGRADLFLGRARQAMLIVGMALCAVVARWAWEIGGRAAALIAAGIVCFDPNIIGNSPLMKTDIAVTFTFAAAGYGLWRVGKKISAGSVAIMAVAAAAAPVVKVSGLLLPVLIGAMLFVRAMLPAAWETSRGMLKTRGARVIAAAGLNLVIAGMFFLIVWWAYRFRAGPVVGPEQSADRIGQIAIWAGREGIVPRAWAGGVALNRGFSGGWPAYLLGMRSQRGWWYYFPLAWLFKTPLATIVAVGVAIFVASRRWREAGGRAWDVMALGAPAAVYATFAMTSHFDAGLRHFLPVYPFLIVGVAAVLGKWIGDSMLRRRVMMQLCAVLVIEVLSARPDYIGFFNWPCRAIGPIHLLGDANLDWGQDLKGLVAWQQEHPMERLYVAFYGVTPPWFYGLRYTPLPGIPFFVERDPQWPKEPCVVAVSATILQGIYENAEVMRFYDALRKERPVEVIGTSIYLYRYTPEVNRSSSQSVPGGAK